MRRVLTLALLSLVMAGCSTEKSGNSSPNETLSRVEKRAPMPAYTGDNSQQMMDFWERRMQLMEHRITALDPENSDLRDLLRRLRDLEDQNQRLTGDISRLEQELGMMSNTNDDIVSQVGRLQQKYKMQDADLNDLRDLVDRSSSRSTPPANITNPRPDENPPASYTNPTTPDNGNTGLTDSSTAPDYSDMESQAGRMRYVSRQVAAMNEEGSRLNELIANIRSYEKEAIPVLISEMSDRASRRKINGCKRALIEIGGTAVVDQLVKELNNPMIQKDAVEILGEIGNRRSEQPLAQLLRATDNEFFRLEIAGALTKMENTDGIATLIEFLKSQDVNKRFLAIDFLNQAFGTERGFKVYDTSAARRQSVLDWEDWYRETYD